MLRADVYARQAVAIRPSDWRRLRDALACGQRLLLPITSGEAWQAFASQVPGDLAGPLRQARVVVPGTRLQTLARAAGFSDVRVAAGPRPAQLLAAAGLG